MRLGILETVGLAASLVFAVPVGLAGAGFLLGDRPFVGATLLVVALLMVVVPRRVHTPDDVPGVAAERVVSAVLPDEEENAKTGGKDE